MKQIILIAHNLRSTFNVGSLLRTADGMAVEKVYLTGYTPYPKLEKDNRLPHMSAKIDAQIAKTALGAEKTLNIDQTEDIDQLIKNLKENGYIVAALEQTNNSVDLTKFKSDDKIALIVGREVEGVEKDILESCDLILEIPMFGSKESFNVSVAAAMALYALRLNH